ncbi:hypothetical protein BACI348_41748 [Bacillus altitudinis]|uniref:Uncharacterized protein n=1 Tax=Bacillus altitudinis TaxID=293387 RepID=A0A653TY47_BACAB|nr:hypothetical protein BACI348_41748 [Bacillus altitudinis]
MKTASSFSWVDYEKRLSERMLTFITVFSSIYVTMENSQRGENGDRVCKRDH